MSNRLALWLLAATILGSSGCTLIVNGVRNVCDEFIDCLDECKEVKEYRSWAKANWERIKRSPCGAVYSADYARGFQEGFVAYVLRGGNGEPPPVPPPCYRTAHYRTPEGYQAIEQWFAGYRHGAAIAQEQGYRRLVTGPSSLTPLPAPEAAGPPPPPPGPVPQAIPTPADAPPREELPPPRTVPPVGWDSDPDQVRQDRNPNLQEPPAGNLATVPFEVQPDPEGGPEAEAPPAPRDLVPVLFEVQPVPDGGTEADNSTDHPEG